MTNFKIGLLYLFGLVSLLVSLGIASQGKPAAVEPLPSPTVSVIPVPKPEAFPGAAKLIRCQALSQPRFFFYSPTLTVGLPQHLLISGTIYASNLSPLPDALVKIWQNDNNKPRQPILFSVSRRTDEAGHYEFSIMKPNLTDQAYLSYRVIYQDYCPLEMHLYFMDEPLSRPAQPVYAQVEVTGPVLQGPVDIVLPVPAPHH
jgi:hypothetical protein